MHFIVLELKWRLNNFIWIEFEASTRKSTKNVWYCYIPIEGSETKREKERASEPKKSK